MTANVAGAAASDFALPALHARFRWLDIALLATFAAVLRLAFFNGPFGSDDVVYFRRALDVAQGQWSSANYNGALRYGFNVPAGVFVALFGPTPFAANLWPLLCSIGEVALVYALAGRLWGRRAALCAGLVLASMPLHMAVATRIHADSVVAFFLTLSFVLLLDADRRRDLRRYFAAGLAMGAVYWTKELAAVTLFAFLAVALFRPQPLRGWLYVGFGAALMFLAHLLLMQWIAGDPLHAIKTVLYALGRNFVAGGDGEDAAGYYFRYLFLNPKHTWLAGFLALLALVRMTFGATTATTVHEAKADQRYVVLWLLSLLVVLSFFPVSLSPLKLTMKQSNYITLFAAPLALLAGHGAATLPPRLSMLAMAAVVAGGAALGALQQADYRAFTSNSKAAVAFAQATPGATVVGTTNNSSISSYAAAEAGDLSAAGLVRSYADVASGVLAGAPPKRLYAVIDPQTAGWMSHGSRVDAPLPCWKPLRRLDPLGLGAGNVLAAGVASALGAAPAPLHGAAAAFGRLAGPAPATVYEVASSDLWCGAGAPR